MSYDPYDQSFFDPPSPEVGRLPSGTAVKRAHDEDVIPPHMLLKKAHDARKEQDRQTIKLLAEKARLESEIRELATKQTHSLKKNADAQALESLVTSFIMGSNVGDVAGYKISPVLDGQLGVGRIVASDNTLIVVRSGNVMNPVFLINSNPGQDHKIFVDLLTKSLTKYMKAWMMLDRVKMPFGDDLPPMMITKEK